MLKLDLQFFAEGEDLDLDSLRADFEKSFQELDDEFAEDEEILDEEVEESEEAPEEDVEEEEQEDEEPAEEEEKPEKVLQTPEQNKAFAEMRRKLEEESKYASIVKQIADANGISPDEVLAKYEEHRLAQQAQQQNVPVDVLKRLNELEQQNQELSTQQFREKFNAEVNSVVEREQLNDDQVSEVFKYIADKNLIDPRTQRPTVNFEEAYFLANKDTIIKREIEKARQSELAAKKKRQTTSAIGNDGGASQETDEITDDFVAKRLAQRGLL